MLLELQRFTADYPRLTAVFVGLFGACVGSFLNVCIHRMPKGESIVTPASRCACGQPIPAWFNLPVIGWLMLRGRARCCGGEISLRYPLVELITALLFVSAWTLLPGPKTGVAFIFLPLLVLLAGCDLDDMTVPDGPNFTLVAAGLFLSVLVPGLHGHTGNVEIPVLDRVASLADSLVGVAVGTAIVWWIRTIGTLLAGREAMGEADIILCAGVGAFCGWQGALFCVFGGSIIGVATALPGLISAKFIKGEDYEGVVPFVPSMAAAGALWFFRGPELVTAWHHWVNG
jgi:leader peptidase (prepilin peptidase)/N-methyltransferase